LRKPAVNIRLCLLFASFLGTLPHVIYSQDQSSSDCDEFMTYTVKGGESIQDISLMFGSDQFEEILYNYNSDIITDKTSLRAGIELKIPINIAQYKKSGLSLDSILNDPYCPPKTDASIEENRQISDEEILTKFREAFDELAKEEADTVVDQRYVQAEKDILSGISGLVIDETRSKIGRDFYTVFYQNWTPPENVSGFTITISEQPAPGLGTIISVKANDTETFKYRLQPRYDFIQQAAQYAVSVTHNYLKNNPQDFVIY